MASMTLIWAHRGASAKAPENTLPAFQLAHEMGADGVELDVQLTADGHVVCIHDETLDRTTTGRGPVVERTLREVKIFDASGGREGFTCCLLYTSPSPRDRTRSRMPSSA